MHQHIVAPAMVIVRAVTLLLVAMVALTSCALAELEGGPGPQTLPPPSIEAQPASPMALPQMTIAHGAPLGDHPTEPYYTLVAHPDEWSEHQGHLPPAAIEAGVQAGPALDSLIVVAFAGARDTSGYSLAVESVVQDQDRVIVTVSQQEPEPGTIVEPAMTLPYHLVSVPRKALVPARGLTIEFQDKDGNVLEQKDLLLP